MSKKSKIAESGIKQVQNDGSEPLTDPAEIQYLDRSATPWLIDTCFKMLHVCTHMADKQGVTDLSKVAEQFNKGFPNPIPVERMADLIKMARTMVKYPMPMSVSKQAFVLMSIYEIVKEAMELDSVDEMKEKINEVHNIIDDMFPEPDEEETSPEAIEAFKKEMKKRGVKVEEVAKDGK
jgi:uncharacterized protein (DUF2249 family)